MPQPIQATVTWDTALDKGTAKPNPIVVPANNGATVIQWSCDATVKSFSISGLDSNVFTPSSSNGAGTSFSTTDSNNQAQECSYTVTATQPSGRTSTHDPKIENGGVIGL